MSREIEDEEERQRWQTPGASPGLASSFLNRFALLKAQAKGYVRQSQARLILQPPAERLQRRIGTRTLQSTLRTRLETLRAEVAPSPGYVGGNLFHLIRKLGFNLAEYDFSRLNVMNITGVTGITDAQKTALITLGAYEQSIDGQMTAL